MEVLNLIFAAATDLPEDEGLAVAAMVMEAFEFIKTDQSASCSGRRSQSSVRRGSSEPESLRQEAKRAVEQESGVDPYGRLLDEYGHLLPAHFSGSIEETLDALLGAAFELPDHQRESAVHAIMKVYDSAAGQSTGGASAEGDADPYELLMLQYGHLVSPDLDRVETLDALLVAATELSDGEGAVVAQLVVAVHEGSSARQKSSHSHRSSVDTRRSSSSDEDPFRRLMVEYGHLLPHRPDTRMATLDLMFVAASALPEDEGDVVAALISDAWEALNAALHGPEPVRGEESEDGDDESEPRPSITSEARSPCPCGGRCGAVCEYEAAVGPQPLRRLAKRRSFRRRQVLSPLPEIGEAGPSRPRKSAMRSASRDLKFWDRSRFKAGPSGSQGLDMLHAFLEREADKAAAEAGETRKGKEREVPRVSFADERGSEERSLSMMSPSASSGSWDEAELIARGLISASDRDMQGESRERREERRRWFRRR